MNPNNDDIDIEKNNKYGTNGLNFAGVYLCKDKNRAVMTRGANNLVKKSKSVGVNINKTKQCLIFTYGIKRGI